MLTRISLKALVLTKSTFLYTVLLLQCPPPPLARFAFGVELLLLLLWCCSWLLWLPLNESTTRLAILAFALLGGMFQVAGWLLGNSDWLEWLVLASDESEVPCDEEEIPLVAVVASSGARGLCELVDSESRSRSRYWISLFELSTLCGDWWCWRWWCNDGLYGDNFLFCKKDID